MKHRFITASGIRIAAALATLAAVGCGQAGAAATPSPSGGQRGGRNGSAGEVAQLSTTSLVLNTANGDVTVNFTASTPVTQTRSGTLSDVAKGLCIVVTGQPDSSGTVIASAARLSHPVGGVCAIGGRPAGTGNPGASPQPSPSGTPRPRPLAGMVTAVAGTSVTIQPEAAGSAPVVITVPTTAQISVADSATPSVLAVGQCVLAAGSKDASGVVTARSLAIQPAGPSGCFTGGGRGGFGGGFGNGGGTGNGGGPPPGAGGPPPAG